MKSTISSVLTSVDARTNEAVEASMVQELSAGIPWWNVAD